MNEKSEIFSNFKNTTSMSNGGEYNKKTPDIIEERHKLAARVHVMECARNDMMFYDVITKLQNFVNKDGNTAYEILDATLGCGYSADEIILNGVEMLAKETFTFALDPELFEGESPQYTIGDVLLRGALIEVGISSSMNWLKDDVYDDGVYYSNIINAETVSYVIGDSLAEIEKHFGRSVMDTEVNISCIFFVE